MRRSTIETLGVEAHMQRVYIVRHSILVVSVFGAVAAVFARPPMSQPMAYHNMADQRALLGIPNALNVLSNLPFAVVGLMGLLEALGRRPDIPTPFRDAWERWPYI